jgi:asparagine synthase (glutamine-hydrolysing)
MAPHVTLRVVSGWVAVFNADGAPVDPGLLRTLIDVPPFSTEPYVWCDGPIGMASAPFRRRSAAFVRPDPTLLVQDHLAVVFDGRLDDRIALLASIDPDVRTDASGVADVELVARAYRTWGSECTRHLLGDFAVGIWDGARRTLVGIRDHFGVKPFYIAQRGSTLIVSNVLRVVRRHPCVSDRLDDRAVGDMLLFGLAMDSHRSMFADISRLPPAHAVLCRAGSEPQIQRYWALDVPDTRPSRERRESVDEFASALRVAVSDRLRGGPVAILMSGGLDSSSVAAMAADLLGCSAPTALRAFTAVYETVAEDEERYYSTLVAATLNIGIDHVPLDGYGLFDRWDGAGLPPEPTTEPMTASTVDMLGRAAQHADAVLAGDGGDALMLPTALMGQIGRVPFMQLMAGLWSSRRAHSRPPIGIRSAVRRWLSARTTDAPPWLAETLRRSLDPRARRIEIDAQRAVNRGPRRTAFNTLIDPWWSSTFETYDPGATAQPVAMRYPFFDVRLVRVALGLPSFPFCVNKHVLREAMRGRLPDAIRLRPKAPLAVVPEAFHGEWSVASAVAALEAAPGIEQYVDVRAFAATVRTETLFTDRAPGTLAAVSLALWLGHSSGTAVAT